MKAAAINRMNIRKMKRVKDSLVAAIQLMQEKRQELINVRDTINTAIQASDGTVVYFVSDTLRANKIFLLDLKQFIESAIQACTSEPDIQRWRQEQIADSQPADREAEASEFD